MENQNQMSYGKAVFYQILAIAVLSSFLYAGAAIQFYMPGILFTDSKVFIDETIPHTPNSGFFNLQYDFTNENFFNRTDTGMDLIHGITSTNSNSMAPTITAGSAVLVFSNFTEADIQIGTIIIYGVEDEEYNVLHRVINTTVKNNKTLYITKGDNNIYADEDPVEFKNIKLIVGAIFY